jgi:phosphomethylpyrimidine synthase
MCSITKDKLSEEANNSEKLFPNSEKVYITGSRENIKVPMRKVNLTKTCGSFKTTESRDNEPIYIYDCSAA